MRPIRKAVSAAGTYYIPVDRNVRNTVAYISGLTGTLAVSSLDWTAENIRMGAAPADGGAMNAPGNGVAPASANWIAKAAGADGAYHFQNEPVDSLRVVLTGAGTGVIVVMQEDDTHLDSD